MALKLGSIWVLKALAYYHYVLASKTGKPSHCMVTLHGHMSCKIRIDRHINQVKVWDYL